MTMRPQKSSNLAHPKTVITFAVALVLFAIGAVYIVGRRAQGMQEVGKRIAARFRYARVLQPMTRSAEFAADTAFC